MTITENNNGLAAKGADLVNPEISLQYVHGERIGYGRLGIQLAAALERQGVDVYDGQYIPPHEGIAESARTESMSEDRTYKDTNVICWVSSPVHAYHGWMNGQFTAMFTMYEATWLPEAFREHMHNFDLIMVPSDQNVELFGRYHPNVKRVTLGVDPDVWHYRKRTDPGVFFDFLLGGSGPRKGGDIAQRAFLAAFPDDTKMSGPIPRLTLKSPRSNDMLLDPERIQVIGGYLSPEEEVDLYARAHCYLQPSRGEGFGLQPLQAIAQGLPTILTDAHGHAAFAHLGYGLSSELVKTPPEGFLHGDHPEMMWWEPDFDELVDRMRYVYDNYDTACTYAAKGATAVELMFTWKNTAAQFQTAVGMENLRRPYTGDGSWYRPTEKLYPVSVIAPWTADIGGKIYQFEPGHTYWEPADVKRVMFTAGKLHPDCYDPADGTDSGLLPGQVANAAGVSASAGYCRDCGQRLNSGPTRADDLLAEIEGGLAVPAP